MDSEKALDKAIEDTIKELEDRGVTREQIHALAEEALAEREREESDPLAEISAKIDKLQESVDAIASKLDRE